MVAVSGPGTSRLLTITESYRSSMPNSSRATTQLQSKDWASCSRATPRASSRWSKAMSARISLGLIHVGCSSTSLSKSGLAMSVRPALHDASDRSEASTGCATSWSSP